MSYVPQGAVDYSMHTDETLALWRARIALELQKEAAAAAIAKKIAETEEMFNRSNGLPPGTPYVPAGSPAAPGSLPKKPGSMDTETIALIGAGVLLAIYIAKGR